MQLQDYIKTIILNKRIKMFNLLIVLMAAINSKIVTACLAFIKLVQPLLKIYQRRQLHILVKNVTILRNISFESVKQLKKRNIKNVQLFWL